MKTPFILNQGLRAREYRFPSTGRRIDEDDLVGDRIEGGAQVLRRTATAQCPSVDAEQGEPGEIGRLGLTKHLRKSRIEDT